MHINLRPVLDKISNSDLQLDWFEVKRLYIFLINIKIPQFVKNCQNLSNSYTIFLNEQII